MVLESARGSTGMDVGDKMQVSVRSAPTRYGTVAKKQRPKALYWRTF
jgi:hypothetical protein